MNVFYYYYYLFYTKVLPDNQPHSTVIYTLSFTPAAARIPLRGPSNYR